VGAVGFEVGADGAARLGEAACSARARGRAGEVFAAAAAELKKRGAEFVQAPAERGGAREARLRAAGFGRGPELLEMEREIPVPSSARGRGSVAVLPRGAGEGASSSGGASGQGERRPSGAGGALAEGYAWTPFSPERRGEFAEVFYRTLEGSLDAPELPVCPDAERLMLSFEERGGFEPEDFALLEGPGGPEGLLLAAAVSGRFEILYMGLVPEARGRGLGRALVGRAIERAAARGAGRVGVFVDRRNGPAVNIYTAAGFSEKCAVIVYLAP